MLKKKNTILIFWLLASFAFAEEKGGVMPCLASFFIGPRVGLEMNEGKQIETIEWIHFGSNFVPYVGLVVKAYTSYEIGGKTNGAGGFFASCCIGPRVGAELNYRKIRTLEWLRLVPCINIYPFIKIPLEAYQGKTMTEIEQKEGLRK